MCPIEYFRSLLGEWPVAKQVSSSLTEVCLAFVRDRSLILQGRGWKTSERGYHNFALSDRGG